MIKSTFLTLSLIFLISCSFSGQGFEAKNKLKEGGSSLAQPTPPRTPVYDPTNLTKALVAAAKTLVQRLPTAEESERAAQGVESYELVIREYLSSAAFDQAMRTYHRDFFEMSGTANGINYEEPANIVTYIIKNNRDYREAITAVYCVDNNLVQQPFCNSFANQAVANDQAAGVITTKGFLEKWQGPHNFKRVKHVFEAFACSEYPDGADTGMTVDEVSNVAKGATAEFNATTGSPVCYSCHRSINPRAALFLNFENSGVYLPPSDRAGLLAQLDAPGTPNNTKNQIRMRITTTEVANREARIEGLLRTPDGNVPVPRYHGDEVTKVRDYAVKLSEGASFKRCAAQRFYNMMIGRGYKESLPQELNYLEQKLVDTNYNIRELIVEITKSFPFVNR